MSVFQSQSGGSRPADAGRNGKRAQRKTCWDPGLRCAIAITAWLVRPVFLKPGDTSPASLLRLALVFAFTKGLTSNQ
jgi:hypothetical protein